MEMGIRMLHCNREECGKARDNHLKLTEVEYKGVLRIM